MLDENQMFSQPAFTSSNYMSVVNNGMCNTFYSPTTINADPMNYYGCTEMKREKLDSKVSVKLEGMDLWERFHSFGTEMIITKNGRRIFPNYRVSISGLDSNTKYMLLLDIVPIDDNRYKYQESAWIVSGKAEPHIYGRYYLHPDSPQTGEQWMKQSITFSKVKITNNPMQNPEQILLNSMHRYIPRLHIVEARDQHSLQTGPLSTFIFPETAFTAVTAYQNDQIKNLKIDHNPFAKGFREPTHGKKNSSKSLKRLQTSLPLDKSKKSEENPTRLCHSDSSVLSSASSSPPTHVTNINSTTPMLVGNYSQIEFDQEKTFFNFSPIYYPQFSYYPYSNDSSYPYTSATYGYYPTNSYNTSCF